MELDDGSDMGEIDVNKIDLCSTEVALTHASTEKQISTLIHIYIIIVNNNHKYCKRNNNLIQIIL